MLAGVLSISLGIATDLLLKLNYLKQLHKLYCETYRNRKWKVLLSVWNAFRYSQLSYRIRELLPF